MSGLELLQKCTITLASFCARNDYEGEHVAVRSIAGVEFQIYKHGATSLIVNFQVILNDVRTKYIMLYVQLELEPM